MSSPTGSFDRSAEQSAITTPSSPPGSTSPGTASCEQLLRLHDEVEATLELSVILSHLIPTAEQLTASSSVFIYLYEGRKKRLVLAGTSTQDQRMIGKIEFALGEGIVGWVGLTQQPVMLYEQAARDPRCRPIPEFEVDRYHSLMCVPMAVRDRRLVGVILARQVWPNAFAIQQQQNIERAAIIAAGPIEKARQYERLQHRLTRLGTFSVLSQTSSAGLTLDDMLNTLVELIRLILEAEACLVMMPDAVGSGYLVTRTSSDDPTGRFSPTRPVAVDQQSWETLRSLSSGDRFPELSDYARTRLDPLPGKHTSTICAFPLFADGEGLGVLLCYFPEEAPPTDEDQSLLHLMARQVANAIKQRRLLDLLTRENLIQEFFNDLMREREGGDDTLLLRASFLGIDLSKLHCVALLDIALEPDETPASPDEESSPGMESYLAETEAGAHQIASRLRDAYPGTLLCRHENRLVCLIDLARDSSSPTLKAWLRDLFSQVRSAHKGMHLAVGLSNAYQVTGDYRRAFVEASMALQIGYHLNHEGGVTHYNDLGVYRYVHRLANLEDLPDPYQASFESLARYDQLKGTDLLRTLETYLRCAGDPRKTAASLNVHRNTVIQRLERIKALCDLDVESLQDRYLDVSLALMVYQLKPRRSPDL